MIRKKEKEKKLKNEKQKEKVVDDEMKRGKSEANTEKNENNPPNEIFEYILFFIKFNLVRYFYSI